MFSIVETIEHDLYFACGVQSSWVKKNDILLWPPEAEANRGEIREPDEKTWIRYQCRVLKDSIATFEEALKEERKYSKHRDSDSFNEEQARKKLKRDHPVNYNEDNSNLIDVRQLINKIDQSSRKVVAKEKGSRIPKITSKQSNQKPNKKPETTNSKKTFDINMAIMPLEAGKSIPMQKINRTTKTETYEEGMELKKRCSKHRNSDSFNEEQEEKQHKRDHPVINNNCKTDQSSRATCTNKNKANKSDSLTKNIQREGCKNAKTVPNALTLKKPIGIKNTSPLHSKKPKLLQMEKRTTSKTAEYLSENKENPAEIRKIVNKYHSGGNEEKATSESTKTGILKKTVVPIKTMDNKTEKPKTSKYHTDCAVSRTNCQKPGTGNFKKPLQSKNEIPLQMKSQRNKTPGPAKDAYENASENNEHRNYRKPAITCTKTLPMQVKKAKPLLMEKRRVDATEINGGSWNVDEESNEIQSQSRPIKPASTSIDVDFQSTMLSEMRQIENLCYNTDRKQAAFETRMQASFDRFTKAARYDPIAVRAPVQVPQASVRIPDRPLNRALNRAPFRASVRPSVRAPVRPHVRTPFRTPPPAAADFYMDDDEMEEFNENFPITIKDNLENVEWNLKIDLDLKHKLLYCLNEQGGKDEEHAIRLRMRYLVSDTVLEKYSWRGTINKNTGNIDKESFKKLKNINNLLFRSVKDQYPGYKITSYQKYMVEWLKHARTRQRKVTYQYPQRQRDNDDENNQQHGDHGDSYGNGDGDAYGEAFGDDYYGDNGNDTDNENDYEMEFED